VGAQENAVVDEFWLFWATWGYSGFLGLYERLYFFLKAAKKNKFSLCFQSSKRVQIATGAITIPACLGSFGRGDFAGTPITSFQAFQRLPAREFFMDSISEKGARDRADELSHLLRLSAFKFKFHPLVFNVSDQVRPRRKKLLFQLF
jgi:hypothetical protein